MDEDVRRAERDAAIIEFVERFAPGANADLMGSMITTVCRLARDGANRGELKLLNQALGELRYAFKIFGPFRNTRKVSIFGSSRTAEHHPEYVQAVKFAERIRQENWMVITGAGDGIMKAGHGGAGREASFGVAIRLPFEQKTNTIIADDPKLVNFKYFFTRKLMFLKEASAVALFPGGFGTQDEGFEAMTLVQTGKADLIPIVMVDAPGGTYWQHWRTYVQAELLRTNMISPEDMNLFRLTDDVETAVQEVVRFYRRYHSQRYVRDQLVLRMLEPLPAAVIQRMNDEFHEILEGGKIEAVSAFSEEADDVPHLPRIAMRFNRRSHGRMRQIVDLINGHDLGSGARPAMAETAGARR